MRFIAIALLGMATLGAMATDASARDGCGRGYFYNGRGCVPMARYYHGGPYAYAPGYRAYPERRFRTWNGCPNGFTVQDGVCKPYRGY